MLLNKKDETSGNSTNGLNEETGKSQQCNECCEEFLFKKKKQASRKNHPNDLYESDYLVFFFD